MQGKAGRGCANNMGEDDVYDLQRTQAVVGAIGQPQSRCEGVVQCHSLRRRFHQAQRHAGLPHAGAGYVLRLQPPRLHAVDGYLLTVRATAPHKQAERGEVTRYIRSCTDGPGVDVLSHLSGKWLPGWQVLTSPQALFHLISRRPKSALLWSAGVAKSSSNSMF